MDLPPIPGMYQARDGMLLCVVFHDTIPVSEGGGQADTTLYQPTRSELERALAKRNYPVEYVMKMLDDLNPKVHTVLIESEKFKEHLREKGYLI